MLVAVVLAAPPAAAAPAPTAPALDIGAVRTVPGAVSFTLSGRGLPADLTLDRAKIHVEAGRVPLSSTRGAAVSRSVSVRAVVLVIDASGGSMRADLQQAKAATRRYVRSAPAGVWFGLVTIADRATVLVPPTADRAAFAAALDTVRPGRGTPLYDGIRRAAELVDDTHAPTAGGFLQPQIVVLSDGIDTQSGLSAIADVTTDLVKAGISTTSIVYGSDADRPQLENLARLSGGRTLTAADAGELGAGFRSITAAHTEPLTVRAAVPAGLHGSRTTLLVTAELTNGTTLRTAEVITFAALPPTAPQPMSTVTPPHSDRWRTVAAVAAALTALLASFAVLDAVVGRSRLQRRLDLLRRFAVTRRPDRRGGLAAARADLAALGERIARVVRVGHRSDALLDRAAVGIRPPEWLMIRIAAATAGAAFGALVLPWWLGLPVGAVVGALLPGVLLRRRINRRARAFADELPEALHLIVSSLRAGFTLQHAIEATVHDGDGPVAAELRRAVSETQMGGELEQSLERLGQRTGSTDIAWLVMAIRLQREVGGNLAEVLQTTADTMRERAYLRRQVRALSAEGRLSAYILMALPLVLGALMVAARPDYIRPLYSEPMGIVMLLVALVLLLIGGLWLRAAVRVEV